MGELEIFSIRIRNIREKLGLNQTDFSKLIDVKQQTLSGYERGIMKPPLDVAKNIAEKCHVSIDWLCGLTNMKNYNDEIITYADMLRLIIKLCNIDTFFGQWEVIHEDNSHLSDLNRTGINFAVLRNADETLVCFFRDWEQIYDLYTAGTIDRRLYDLWLSDRLKQYENLPLVPPIADDIPDDNLPF